MNKNKRVLEGQVRQNRRTRQLFVVGRIWADGTVTVKGADGKELGRFPESYIEGVSDPIQRCGKCKEASVQLYLTAEDGTLTNDPTTPYRRCVRCLKK